MIRRVVFIFIASFLWADRLLADVTIVRTEPVVEQRTFDPKNPPKEMPKLHANESAVTQSEFQADTRVGGKVLQGPKTSSGESVATVTVENLRMTLRMRVTVWVPADAVPKTINHEQGHRKIAERYYAGAEQVARDVAHAMIGQTVSGRGADAESASDAALDAAIQMVGRAYLQKTDAPCGKAQEIYDRITEHGTNTVKEDNAIEQAIAEAQS